jgi:adenosylmethionine-8-amino-7-oxononanoate aminotransferase
MATTTDLVILGTDTDAGKTAVAMLWLAAAAPRYEYWKPLESGESDTERVRRCVPAAHVHAPLAGFSRAVAPLLAARLAGQAIPSAAAVVAAKPACTAPGRGLLIETFGSPFSPLGEAELQVALVRALGLPTVLVSNSAVGAVGRTLQTLHALKAHGVTAAVVLFGPADPFAAEQIARHWPETGVFSLGPPHNFDREGMAQAAGRQRTVLAALEASVLRSRGTTILPCPDRPSVGRGGPCTANAIINLIERDRRCVWHPYTSLREPDRPLLAAGGTDEFIELADGRRLIDGISSWWTILHGHRYAPLMAALAEAAQAWDHVHFAGLTHAPGIALAELLLGSLGWTDGRVFFSDNGSTAVEVALKMAYQYWCHRDEPQRTCFVGFEGGYHGDTFGAMSVSRDPVFFGRFEPLLFRAEIVPLSAERLGELLTRRAGEVAAIIVEPLVQGAGGMRMHSPAELAALAAVARRHGVLWIADEVMTGGGRTGRLWAHQGDGPRQATGASPDLICAAKTLAGGVLPLAATLAAPHVAAAWDTDDRRRTFFHGHSFTAHPLACAVALANWKLLTAAPPTAPARMEVFWNDALRPLRTAAQVRQVRVCGSIAAVELDVPGGYLADAGRRLRAACLEQGVLLRPLGSVLYAMPPFCTSERSLEQIARAMIRAVGA